MASASWQLRFGVAALIALLSAKLQAQTDFLVTPNVLLLSLPETDALGTIDFTIVNLLPNTSFRHRL